MKIAFVCYFKEGRISGPSRSIVSLSQELEGHDSRVTCSVFTSDRGQEDFLLNGRRVYAFSKFHSRLNDFDIVVLAGIYDVNIWRIGSLLRASSIPYVVSPRSNLMKMSFFKSAIKKVVAHLTFTRRLIRKSSGLHFLSDEERKNSFSYAKPYFLSRNGVSIGIGSTSERERPRLVSFVGRIDFHHKGLDVCLRSIRDVAEIARRDGWSFRFYGPANSSSRDKFQRIVSTFGLDDLVVLKGPVHGEAKETVLRESRFFIHTSRYEGQPQAVLEAMSQGAVPIVTEGTNLGFFVNKYKAGWCVSFSRRAVSSALSEALLIGNWREKSFNAIRCVEAEFDWSIAAKEFLDGLISLRLVKEEVIL